MPGARARSLRRREREPRSESISSRSRRARRRASTTQTSRAPAAGCTSRTRAPTASMSSTARSARICARFPTCPASQACSSTRSTTCCSRPIAPPRGSASSAAPMRTPRPSRGRAAPERARLRPRAGNCTRFNLGEPLGERCTASIVDVDSLVVAAELALPGRPRWALFDEESDRVYANIHDPPRSSSSTATEVRSQCNRGSGRRPAWPLAPRRPTVLRRRRRRARRPRSRRWSVDRDVAAARRPRRRGSMRRPRAPTLRSATPACRSFDTDKLELARDGRDRARCAHDRLGSARRHLYVFCPGAAERRGLRGT